MELQDILSKLTQVRGGPQNFTARCPAHEDHHNSLSIAQASDGRILLYCHAGCAVAEIAKSIGFQLHDLAPSRARGEENLQNCKKASAVEAKEIVYPYYDESKNLLFEVVRRMPKQFFQRRYENGKAVYNLNGITPVLYRLPEVKEGIAQGNAEIFLCEGEKDALRLAKLGYLATSAPMGAGKWRASYTQSLLGAKRVLVVPDNDEPGRKHAMQVLTELETAGIPTAVCDLLRIYPQLPEKGDVSDLLDVLGDLAAKQLHGAVQTAAAFCEQFQISIKTDDTSNYIFSPAKLFMRQEFLEILKKEKTQTPIKTGFAALDEQVEQHLYAGLYVVGSVSSLGKTAFCLQMADFIASGGQDVLFFSLEMSREEMLARSLTRIFFTQSHYKGSCSMAALLRGDLPQEALEKAMLAYENGPGAHLSFLEGNVNGTGVEDIVQIAQAHKETTGRSPVVFVDYLQILRPPDLRMSDKQATDLHVTRLKRLSRELFRPVIAVSSFNRQNYSEAVNLASFKESGAIEYSADFVLGLQAQGVQSASTTPDEKRAARLVNAATLAAKQQSPRPLEAVTLKNRRGPAFASFSLEFYPQHNLFVDA